MTKAKKACGGHECTICGENNWKYILVTGDKNRVRICYKCINIIKGV